MKLLLPSALLVALAIGCSPPTSSTPPNVLLVTLDTTRADHLGIYGYERPTTPNLDELAAHAIVFDHAYSTSSWTLPAHASLFTGKFPTSHGVRHDPAGSLVLAQAIRAPEAIRARGLGVQEATLASILRDAGFATGAVVAGPWLLRPFGFARGFDHYDDEGIRDAVGRGAGEITGRAIEWLEDAEHEPFFLFLNYFDPHAPYWPPRSYARTFLPEGVEPDPKARGQVRDLYDAEILYMDHELGRLLRFLRQRGLYERTLVVVTADHGELLGERGEWGHERFLWEPLVRVPLLVKPPGPPRAGRREATRTSLVDVLPLVLEQVGLPVHAEVQGQSPPAGERPVVAEVAPMSPARDTGRWRAHWDGPFKALSSSLGDAYLFDLESDPDETHNLAEEDPERMRRAAESLERTFAGLPPAPPEAGAPQRVDEQTVEALRGLGYLE